MHSVFFFYFPQSLVLTTVFPIYSIFWKIFNVKNPFSYFGTAICRTCHYTHFSVCYFQFSPKLHFKGICKHLALLGRSRIVVASQWPRMYPRIPRWCPWRYAKHGDAVRRRFWAFKDLDSDWAAFCPPSPWQVKWLILGLARYDPTRQWSMDYHWIVPAAKFRFPAMGRMQTRIPAAAGRRTDRRGPALVR